MTTPAESYDPTESNDELTHEQQLEIRALEMERDLRRKLMTAARAFAELGTSEIEHSIHSSNTGTYQTFRFEVSSVKAKDGTPGRINIFRVWLDKKDINAQGIVNYPARSYRFFSDSEAEKQYEAALAKLRGEDYDHEAGFYPHHYTYGDLAELGEDHPEIGHGDTYYSEGISGAPNKVHRWDLEEMAFLQQAMERLATDQAEQKVVTEEDSK